MENERTKGMKAEEVYFSLNEISKATGLSFPTVKKCLESLKPVDGSYDSHLYRLLEVIPLLFPKLDKTMSELKLQREREETRLAAAKATKVTKTNIQNLMHFLI